MLYATVAFNRSVAAGETLSLAFYSSDMHVIEHRCIQIIDTVQSVALSCIKCTEIAFYFNERNAAICKEIWVKSGYFQTLSLYFPLIPVLSVVTAEREQRRAGKFHGNTTNE